MVSLTDCRTLAPNDDCWGVPVEDCLNYYDTHGGGRGCRVEGGNCDGFDDAPYSVCADGADGEKLQSMFI